jgi:hypothetical protein
MRRGRKGRGGGGVQHGVHVLQLEGGTGAQGGGVFGWRQDPITAAPGQTVCAGDSRQGNGAPMCGTCGIVSVVLNYFYLVKTIQLDLNSNPTFPNLV